MLWPCLYDNLDRLEVSQSKCWKPRIVCSTLTFPNSWQAYISLLCKWKLKWYCLVAKRKRGFNKYRRWKPSQQWTNVREPKTQMEMRPLREAMVLKSDLSLRASLSLVFSLVRYIIYARAIKNYAEYLWKIFKLLLVGRRSQLSLKVQPEMYLASLFYSDIPWSNHSPSQKKRYIMRPWWGFYQPDRQ